ncbi:hypothetical protein ACP70R_010344 [Stipagrostis hirtigluma subsp. patula]
MADVSEPTSSRRRPPDTSSRCRAETVTGTHDFEVANYSLLDGHIGRGKSVTSTPFTVGGNDWTISFYPDGSSASGCCCAPAASAYVTLLDGAAGTVARYTLSLVDGDGNASRLWRRRASTRRYGWPNPTSWGFHVFFRKPFLRFSRCLVDDRLRIRCELTVLAPPRTVDTTPAPAPPPELPVHLERALRDGRGADVTFDVAGRVFRAHRLLLAARSPVFDAELFGPMAEKDAQRVIEIVDVEPAIFEMLLHFIYTESLPGCFEGYSTATTQHLLVAADRYGLDRLKLMCAEKLCKSMDVSSVMSTLALADQHHCQQLKEACVAFMSLPRVLGVVVATDEFKHLMASCPRVLEGSLGIASVDRNEVAIDRE